MKAIKILFIMTLSLNAISVNRALFDLKDSQLKGELTPKIVNFGGYKSSTTEWGATALNYINAANGDAKKFSALVEKMRFNSGILGNFRVHARLRQALKLQKNLKYCLKIIARDSFYSYRTGIYIPLGISLKDQKTAQKMLADLSVVGAYLKKQQENEKAQSPYYRSNDYYNSYYSPYYGMYGMGMYGMYGMGMYGMYGMGMYDFYDFYDGMYGFYPNMFFMMQVQDYLMLENYMYALDQEEILDHDASINQLDTPTDDDKDDKDDKSLQQANLMSFYRDPKFSKGIQTNRLNSALVNLDNSRMLKDNSLFHTKAMPTKSVDAITSQAKELNHLVGQIKEMKQDGASPSKIDSVVNKAMEVRDKLDNNLNQLDNDLKDQKGLSSEQQAQVDKALDSVQQLSHSSDVVGNYLDGSLKIDGDDRDDLNDAINNPMQQPAQQTPINNMDNTHANDSKDQGGNALINPNSTTNDDHNDDHMDTNTTDTGNANDTSTDDKDASGNNTGDMNNTDTGNTDTGNTDTGNTDTGNTDDMSNMNNGNDDTGNANDDMGNSNDMGDDMNNANDMNDDMGNSNDDMGDMGDMNDDMGGDMGDMGDMGGDMGN
ncbi:dentin sialophosphopreproprotein [Helicobacter pylori]|uniref:dentin sialophosphopreproprotein n=1 Tax=Helicobacter pylori TaxID=210 RepID=UPI0018D06D1A|nr:dentin sialophosphopreproprotein [Helicobacter pylori]MBH0283050.1 dentin sialophosphopreproprotein [Helicobacter pylori]MBH0287405.1 dentin sialophosphopreproprotein [Helicobacter pylori]MBH0290486.1 dentin sialophosphopreproprotein [Helicobacter pylori]